MSPHSSVVERVLGKNEVSSSTLLVGSILAKDKINKINIKIKLIGEILWLKKNLTDLNLMLTSEQ